MNYWNRTIIVIFTFCFLVSCKEKSNVKKAKNPEYSLQLDRGAFHYDRFDLTPTKLYFYPLDTDSSYQKKYTTPITIKMDTTVTLAFFRELEKQGIWDLKEHYIEESSCTSTLRIIFKADKKETIIKCDDYKRGCPELISYIEEKIIALEGNNLKRIYLPG